MCSIWQICLSCSPMLSIRARLRSKSLSMSGINLFFLLRLTESLEQGLTDVAAIAKQLAPEIFGQSRYRRAVIHITRREAHCQQVSGIVHHEM